MLGDQFYPSVMAGLEIFSADTLLFEPRSNYSYSSYAWNLVSAIMENVAKQDFLTFMERNVFNPLEMHSISPEHRDSSLTNLATFYETKHLIEFSDFRFFNLRRKAPHVDNSYKWAGGGFISTTEDIVNFLHSHSKSGYLTDESLNILMNPQTIASAGTTNYGIGWRKRYGNNNEVLYGHTGGSVGGTTYAFIAIDYNVIVVITSNLSDASFGNLPNDIFEIYY